MGDEAMFRMDAALAATFSSIKQDRGASAKLAREDLIHFKMRVASLLEAYIKRCPASPLLPAVAAPLLSALAAASRPGGGHQPLADRLVGLLVNRLCRSRAEASGAGGGVADDEALAAQLRRALYLASRSPDKREAQAAAETYLYLLRVATGAAASAAEEGADQAEAGSGSHPAALTSAQAALDDFFTKKRSRLGRPFLEGLLRRLPALGAALQPALLARAASGRSEFLRAEAWGLLATSLKVRQQGAAVYADWLWLFWELCGGGARVRAAG